MTPEDVVRAYFEAYSEGRPERFDELVSADYVDYGHTPPGHGVQGARDDYEHAVQITGGLIRYDIDALVARDDNASGYDTFAPHDGQRNDRSTATPRATPVTKNGNVIRGTRFSAVTGPCVGQAPGWVRISCSNIAMASP